MLVNDLAPKNKYYFAFVNVSAVRIIRRRAYELKVYAFMYVYIPSICMSIYFVSV